MNTTLTNSTSFDFSAFSIFMISIHAISFFLGLPLNCYVIVLLFPRRGVMDNTSDVFSWNQAISEIFFVLFGLFNSLCNCCMCLERYLAVVHPVTFLSEELRRRTELDGSGGEECRHQLACGGDLAVGGLGRSS
ncbi:hypothetical protein AOLI_G00004120 [Acnodon oligacanthus]